MSESSTANLLHLPFEQHSIGFLSPMTKPKHPKPYLLGGLKPFQNSSDFGGISLVPTGFFLQGLQNTSGFQRLFEHHFLVLCVLACCLSLTVLSISGFRTVNPKIKPIPGLFRSKVPPDG